MDWIEVRVHTSAEAVESVSFYLQEQGVEGVVIEDAEVLSRDWDTQYGKIIALEQSDYPAVGAVIKAYVPVDEEAALLQMKLAAYLDKLPSFGLDPGAKQITMHKIEKQDWAESWKAYYRPIQVTERMAIKPVWEAYQRRTEDEIVIELDPGLAFGTGDHATTRQCLRLLEQYVKPGDRVIDVGCGSGILSIAAAKLQAAHTIAVDLDPEAVRQTKQQLKLNGVSDEQVTVALSDGLRGISEQAEIIVANILAEILVPVITDIPRVLMPSGVFIAAGIIEPKKTDVIQACERVGLQLLSTYQEGDWVAITAKKW